MTSEPTRLTNLGKSRDAQTMSRDLEFFSESELTKQIGHTRELWPTVILAELIDNALDHCEENNRLPHIRVRVTRDRLTVSDNGNGIPASVIEGLRSTSTRTSSRVGYKTPTRGAQGNAGKCLVALPYVWGDGFVVIRTGGKKHTIRASVDPIEQVPNVSIDEQLDDSCAVDLSSSQMQQESQDVQFERECLEFEHFDDFVDFATPCSQDYQIAHNVAFGTTVEVVLSDLEIDTETLLEKYALVNPHATFELVGVRTWHRSENEIKRWVAGKPEPIGWYAEDEFIQRLIGAVRADRQNGKDRTVADFLGEFAGFRRSEVRKKLIGELGMQRLGLSQIIADERQQELYQAISSRSDAVQPKSLGKLGRNHVQARLSQVGCSEVKYKNAEGFTSNGLPFVLEVAFGYCDRIDERRVITAVNGAPSVYEPCITMVESQLERNYLESNWCCYFLVNLLQPSVCFTNRGKTELAIDEVVATELERLIQCVLKDHVKYAKALERNAEQESRRRSKAARSRNNLASQRHAIFELLPESVDAMSLGGTVNFDARSHYYWMRDAIQRLTGEGEVLQQNYLDRVIDEWESQNGVIQFRERDARGFLYEPHSGRTIPLGTKEVAEYSLPDFLFHTLLYVEKKGLLTVLKHFKLAERYDVGIIAAEGFSTRASQELMQKAANGHGMKVIVLHDADPSGYGIANALGRDSGAHKFDYEVIDAGLTIEEAVGMGLSTESFNRKNALPSNINWSPMALEYFEGEPSTFEKENGKESIQYSGCRRVELNALSSDPARFAAWVESKLQIYGCDGKLLPPIDVAWEHARSEYEESLEEMITQRLIEENEIPEQVDKLLAMQPMPEFLSLSSELELWAREILPQDWRSFVSAIAKKVATDTERNLFGSN